MGGLTTGSAMAVRSLDVLAAHIEASAKITSDTELAEDGHVCEVCDGRSGGDRHVCGAADESSHHRDDRGVRRPAQAALDANARAFLTLAEGDNFCAAADIVSSFLGKDSNFARRMLAKAFAVVHKIEHLPIRPSSRCADGVLAADVN
jgi:hypothetical protein